MSTFEQLVEEAKKDLAIDKEYLETASIQTPDIHNKYLRKYVDAGLALKRAEVELKKVTQRLRKFYDGKADPEDYEGHEFDPRIKILKADLMKYVETDDEYIQAEDRVFQAKRRVEFLERTVKQIERRGFEIKNAIDWQKFKKGYNY